MQLTICFERYVGLQRIAKDEYISLPPLYHICAKDDKHNLYVFRSDGLKVTPKDLRFVHMHNEQSHNSYSWFPANKAMKRVMAKPLQLYADAANNSSATREDIKLIRRVIEAVTSTPVCFPTDDRDGLSQNKVTISF